MDNHCKIQGFQMCMENRGVPAQKIVTPSSSNYETANFQWNKFFEKVYPMAIFLPVSAADVKDAVICGTRANLLLVPSSGGHSYAGLSAGTNTSILIDFQYMNSIHINPEERSVTVGPGALVGPINAKLWENGGYGTPLGNCMTVGIGGHVIGGGIGYWSGAYGLALDNILELEIVDALGNILTVNPTSHSDLWWALQGIGPGYIGLVTSIKLKLFKAENLKVTFVRLQYELKAFADVLEGYFKFLDLVKYNEPYVMSVIFVVSDNYNLTRQPLHPGVEVQLVHVQDPENQPNSNEGFLENFSKSFPKTNQPPIISTPCYIELLLATGYSPVVKTKAFWESKSPLHFISSLNKGMALPRYFFTKSFFVNRKFEAMDLKNVQKVLSQIPDNTMGLMLTSEGGKISEPKPEDSAYVHRNSLFDFRIHFDSDNVDDVAPGREWLSHFWNATRFMDSGETYQNFPDLELPDYLTRYYGVNLK